MKRRKERSQNEVTLERGEGNEIKSLKEAIETKCIAVTSADFFNLQPEFFGISRSE